MRPLVFLIERRASSQLVRSALEVGLFLLLGGVLGTLGLLTVVVGTGIGGLLSSGLLSVFSLLLLGLLLLLRLLLAEDFLSQLVQLIHLLFKLVHSEGGVLSQLKLVLLLHFLIEPVSGFFDFLEKVLLILLSDPRHGLTDHVSTRAGLVQSLTKFGHLLLTGHMLVLSLIELGLLNSELVAALLVLGVR